ncbi:MAG: hypothetical protein KME43_25830 [Myxacorys chilensis ATA2-1-KO14]|nr:hypothetical protein [Myxacorys chilensis ATA2-1-KO14]
MAKREAKGIGIGRSEGSKRTQFVGKKVTVPVTFSCTLPIEKAEIARKLKGRGSRVRQLILKYWDEFIDEQSADG